MIDVRKLGRSELLHLELLALQCIEKDELDRAAAIMSLVEYAGTDVLPVNVKSEEWIASVMSIALLDY